MIASTSTARGYRRGGQVGEGGSSRTRHGPEPLPDVLDRGAQVVDLALDRRSGGPGEHEDAAGDRAIEQVLEGQRYAAPCGR